MQLKWQGPSSKSRTQELSCASLSCEDGTAMYKAWASLLNDERYVALSLQYYSQQPTARHKWGILDKLSPSLRTSRPQSHEWTQPRSAKSSLCQQNPLPTYRLMRNYKLCCFKLLDYGVVHYTAIANWYKMEAGLKFIVWTLSYTLYGCHVLLNILIL